MTTADKRLEQLEEEIDRLKRKGKDGWDRFAIFMSALVPLAIAGVGGYYSYSSQKSQTEVAEIRAQAEWRVKQAELVSKFFDSLTGADERKRQFAVDSLLVAAPDYGPLLVRAVARSGPPGEVTYEKSALNERRDMLVRQLYVEDPAQRKSAYEQLLFAWGSDETLIPALIAYGLADKANGNGNYNALVLLSHMQRETIHRRKEDILGFAGAVEGNGPKTKERADILRSRLGG
jgi:hypothetical protein